MARRRCSPAALLIGPAAFRRIQFVATDVCEVLGIKNPTDAISRLDDDEKALAFIEGIPGGQRINVVNQFGLTRLILRSNKPKAKQFQRWVIHDVLPSIYKTGRYDTKQDDAPPRLASSDDNVFVRVPRPPASTPFAHYIVTVTPEGSNVVEPSDFDPIRDRLRTLSTAGSGVIQAWDVDPSDAWPDG